MSTYDTWKSTDPRDGEPDWNNEREQDTEQPLLCIDCAHGNHELMWPEGCSCPCHGGQQ